ncbi:MAG: ribosome silencing factor [Parvularculaceae bacterium]|nr:ribosome silencing factor [Parvularculaceae bacterium]
MAKRFCATKLVGRGRTAAATRRTDLTTDHRPAQAAPKAGPALAIVPPPGAEQEASAAPGSPTIDDLSGLSPEERAKAALSLILRQLDDDKAEDVVTIDLCGKTDIADAMVVASGRSARHVGAMADKIVRKLRESGLGRAKLEGAPACDWVLIDAEDVIVHLFRPEVRQFYNLERIWSETARAPLRPDA